ncbi:MULTISPECIES: hypothetical protein [unclassified Acinetobacter]|uniref:hypothetical protein n=1 Tax=unclassified Acinetobacter TaxID=196816 RepID=UPI001C21FCD4|nr:MULTISPECIES: hypothetical protein [unclassified Acinetobacter]
MTFIKNIFLGVASIILLVACSPGNKDRGTITVHNKTETPVYNVNFKYTTSKRVDAIGDLTPNASYQYEIQYSDTEDSITINYTDKDKKNYSESVVAYSAKYDKENIIFNIE